MGGNQAACANNLMGESMEASAAEEEKSWMEEIRAAMPKKSLIKIIGGGLCAVALVIAGRKVHGAANGDDNADERRRMVLGGFDPNVIAELNRQQTQQDAMDRAAEKYEEDDVACQNEAAKT